MRGLASVAAFNMAALLGGKRARSLVAVKLGDVRLTASKSVVDGKVVLVPALHVSFTDEKFADLRGDRQAADNPTNEGYSDNMWFNGSYWIYRMLVIRGVFSSMDPILEAELGQELTIRPDCSDFYLFCDCNATAGTQSRNDAA